MGQGKPYGFGKVKYEVQLSDPQDKDCIFYMKQFEEEMSKFVNNWCNQQQIRELITLTAHSVGTEDVRFRYMKMSNNAKENEFANARGGGEFLQPFSVLVNKNINAQSIVRQEEEAQKEQNEQRFNSLAERVSIELAKASTDIEPQKLDVLVEDLKLFCEQQTDKDIVTEIKYKLDQLDKKKKEQEDKADQDKQEQSYLKGFEVFIQNASSVQKCFYLSQKWIKLTKKFDNGRKHLNESEINLIIEKIKLVYKDTDKKDCTPKKGKYVAGFQKLVKDMTQMLALFNTITNQQ